MIGHPHWRGQAPSEPGRSGSSRARSRRGLVAFAIALAVALGTVLLIAAGSVHAMSHSAVFNAKADDWVGLAAIGSVLVCAFLGMVIVHRYTSTKQR